MGGIGSGARRSTHIGNVSDMLALDIRALRRLNVVRPGECVIETLRWSIGGLSTSSARLRTDMSDCEHGGTMTITVQTPEGHSHQQCAIEAVPSRFGGYRCYFICPVTGNRSEILYYAGGRFASRQGHRLAYATQSMTDLDRARRKVQKLRRRLKGAAFIPCPRGRHRAEVVKQLRDAERQAQRLHIARLSAVITASGTR